MISASLRRLQIFKCVVETGSFSSAASRFGISQPSVSTHVRALENLARAELFTRNRGRAPSLTPAGKVVYEYALEVEKRSSAAERQLTSIRADDNSEISVAISRSLVKGIGVQHIASFLASRPRAKIITRSETGEKVIELLRANLVDVAIFLSYGPIKGLPSEIIGQEEMVLTASPRHPLARADIISPTLLSNHAFVSAIGGSHFQRLMAQLMRRLGLSNNKIAIEAQDSDTVKELTRLSVGISWSQKSSVEEELRNGDLVQLCLDRPIPPLEIRFAAALDRELSATAKLFLQHLRKYIVTLPKGKFVSLPVTVSSGNG